MAGKARKWLLAAQNLLTCSTVAEAATKTGISERTLLRWLKNPEFRKLFEEARRQVVEKAMSMVQAAATDAANALHGIVRDANAPSGARVSSARALLELAIKSGEIQQLAERMAKLETTIQTAGRGR
jgi:phage terminase small subunit